MKEHEWRKKAACFGLDANLFVPEYQTRETVAKAKEVCYGCPVRDECLEAYLRLSDQVIAGGFTHKERRAIKRQRLKAQV